VCEMRQGVCVGRRRGSEKGAGRVGGVVAEKPRDGRECACAGPRRRAERAELTRMAHGAEREKRDARGNGSTTGDLGPRDRERESGGSKLAPTGCSHRAESERGSARGRMAADRRGPPVRDGTRVGARPGRA
jgi:hypothetical protein